MEKHIVSFSGGKDSTAMLLKMIDNNYKIDEIIFCDTGKEFEEMYEHINLVQSMINIPITILRSEKTFEYWMFEHVKTKGKNKGSKGYSWPDFRNRWCTQALKKQVIKDYLKKYKDFQIIEYHGIAVDEIKRTDKNKEKNVVYPLIEWNMTENDCLEYCYSKGLNWNGLYEKLGRVSCWCCPLKSLKELEIIYNQYPRYWKRLKEWDKNTYRQFRSDYSIEELEEKFKKKSNGTKQLELVL